MGTCFKESYTAMQATDSEFRSKAQHWCRSMNKIVRMSRLTLCTQSSLDLLSDTWGVTGKWGPAPATERW